MKIYFVYNKKDDCLLVSGKGKPRAGFNTAAVAQAALTFQFQGTGEYGYWCKHRQKGEMTDYKVIEVELNDK